MGCLRVLGGPGRQGLSVVAFSFCKRGAPGPWRGPSLRKNLFISLPTRDEGVQRSLGPEAGLDDISAAEGESGGTVEEERGTRYSARGDEDAPRAGVTEVDAGGERMTATELHA